ncbi:hypothetical protein HOLleu_39976 [Holothuria leucospilota]|uniref:Tyrosine-protein kinase ephrin type A/B receptor-like domain-containing protein n=1 Tax=Holothuria leucospilota TaxID=206669 RepID=A0A9Q0YEM6_HOLLE|nr:hypothetical protein HOLleu_39976 [Holothuria leucospilota]
MLSGLTVTKLYLFENSLSTLLGSLFDDQLGKSFLNLMQVQNNPLRNISKDFLSSLAEGGELIVSCDQLEIPKFQPDITVSCVPPTFVTRLKVFYGGHVSSLLERGFSCTEGPRLRYCSSCAVGTYGNKKQLTCVPCPRGGFYQDEVGQYQSNGGANGCKTCNSGTFVMSGGGNNPLSCQVCPEGTNKTKHAGYRACFCLDNYVRRDRFGKCELCPQAGLNCSNDFVTILSGYYWSWNITNFNLYKTYVENLLTINDSYDNESTSFRVPFPKVYECPQRHKCSNNASSIQLEATCEEGYRGWMCTECEEGYFPVSGFCQKCPSIWAFVAEMFVFIVVVAFFFTYVGYTYRRERNSTERSIVDIALARGKIVLAFYQIMGEFWDSLDVVNWPDVFRQVANWLNIVQFNLAVLVVKPCCFFPKINLSPYQMFVFGVSLPPVVVLLTTFVLLLSYSRLWYLKRSNIRFVRWNLKLKRLKERVLTMALMTLYITYPSTSNVIFTLYPSACETFDLDETKNTEKISLLRSNYSIKCDTDIHFKYKTAAYIASFYVVAFPCFLFCLLKKYLKSGATILTSSRQENPKWLRFLCENYKDEFWFWEIIELTRRVSQTFVIILFGWDSSLSVTVTLTLAVVFLTLHTSYAPMKDKFEHYLQVLASLWAIFLNMLVAAVPIPDAAVDSPRIEPVMTAILIGLNLSVLSLVIAKPVLWVFKLLKPWKVMSWIIELLPTINWRIKSATVSTPTNTSFSQYDDGPTDEEPFLHQPNNYHSLP